LVALGVTAYLLRPHPQGLARCGVASTEVIQMNKILSSEFVLPRPVEVLPEYASSKARRALAERLISAFDLSEDAAAVISNAVVDPSSVRKAIGEASDPQVDEILVPGGAVLAVRAWVWSRRIMPDP